MKLGERIYRARRTLRMSQIEFAEALGVSQSAISNWETGADRPSVEMLFILADVTDDQEFVSRESLTGKAEPVAKLEPKPVKPVPRHLRTVAARLDRIEAKLDLLTSSLRGK